MAGPMSIQSMLDLLNMPCYEMINDRQSTDTNRFHSWHSIEERAEGAQQGKNEGIRRKTLGVTRSMSRKTKRLLKMRLTIRFRTMPS